MSSADLEKLYLENQTILRVACHDIANALSIILTAATQCLEWKKLTDDEREYYCSRIYHAAQEQKELMQRLKSLQELLTSRNLPKLEPLNLCEKIRHAEFFFSDLLSRKRISLLCDLPDEDLLILTEPKAFTPLILNCLISNAIKYSEPGGIVHVTVSQTDSRVSLTVCDSGIGIPDTALSNLFCFDNSLRTKGTLGEVGIGMGLAMMKICLDRCETEVSITSHERSVDKTECGTTVTLSMKAYA